jgi:hypothetical protein
MSNASGCLRCADAVTVDSDTAVQCAGKWPARGNGAKLNVGTSRAPGEGRLTADVNAGIGSAA